MQKPDGVQHSRGRGLGYEAAIAATVGGLQWWLSPSTLNQAVVLYPYLQASGFAPYTHIQDPRMPLWPTTLAWCLSLTGGDAISTARVVHVAITALVLLLVLRWLRRERGTAAMLAGGLFFLAWHRSLGYWATSYYDVALGLVLFAVFVRCSARDVPRPAVASFALGLLCGIAVMVKQHAVVPCAAILFCRGMSAASPMSASLRSAPRLIAVAGGILAPAGVYAAYYRTIGGRFEDWLFWTVQFPLQPDHARLVAQLPGWGDVAAVASACLMVAPFVAFLAAAPGGERPSRADRVVLLVGLLASLVLLVPRYSTRHLAAAAPFLAAVSGIAMADLWKRAPRRVWAARVLVLVVASWWVARAWSVVTGDLAVGRPPVFHELSPLVPLADSIRAAIPPGATVVVAPTDESNSNLYYLLGQRPPRYYFDFYAWSSIRRTTRAWVEAVELEKPDVLVRLPGPDAAVRARTTDIWRYAEQHYHPIRTLKWGDRDVVLMERITPR